MPRTPVWPPKRAQQWPLSRGGFGAPPPSSGRWTLSPASSTFTPLGGGQPNVKKSLSQVAAIFVFLAVGMAVASLLLRTNTSVSRQLTPTTTTARSEPPTTARASDWPTATKAVAQSANAAVTLATKTAGEGWVPSGLASSPERASADAPSRPVWRVDLVNPTAATAGSVPFRTYRIDADGNITLVQNTTQALPPSGVPATMSPYWPVALGAAIDLVATPTRQSGPILVRFGCSTDDPPVCGWELRFLTSATKPTEYDRVYVTDNGQKTMGAPSWATPR